MSRRGFRKLLIVVGVASLLVIGAGAEEVETRIFSGSGSRTVTSDIEFFVVGGTYEHELETASSCFATAGVFPSERLPRVNLREVLGADLFAGITESSSRPRMTSGTFAITTPGWAVLQVGTGPTCSWTYSIRGAFLPLGDEPRPPGSGALAWWELALLVLAAVAGLGLFVRRGVSVREGTAEDNVRPLPSTSTGDDP